MYKRLIATGPSLKDIALTGLTFPRFAALFVMVLIGAAATVTVVTADEPASGEYTTIYVGGDNSWFYPGSSVIGVASYDIGNTDPSNFGFIFTEELSIYQQYSYGDLDRFSEYMGNVITHEAGHTFAVDNVNRLP